MPCKDAFAYLPAQVPDGATNLWCRSHGVLDETFQVTFRMPQAGPDASANVTHRVYGRLFR
ncbi:hypothetical protein ADK99_28525 [Streptomyces sp. MMG1064]|nr:hypothetical protein ADK89_28250 [Streptomyces sp. XY37]KOV43494.1 hypothetical protein ADK99_28525 [Streptomyces sp. MMG1064]